MAALTAASEKVSFTKVIAKTPALNWLDMLGRRPADQVAASETESEGGQPLDNDADQTATVPKNSGPL